MNNKKIGTAFEEEMVEWFVKNGYWTHFLSPDKRGSQPFDIIAVRNGNVVVGDCKTCSKNSISISRLEDNQISAFEKWIAKGNSSPYIFAKHRDMILFIPYTYLKSAKTVKLIADNNWIGGWWLE